MKKRLFGILLTDMSKALDCIVHGFLIAKLEPYGVNYEELNVIESCFSDETHWTKISDS